MKRLIFKSQAVLDCLSSSVFKGVNRDLLIELCNHCYRYGQRDKELAIVDSVARRLESRGILATPKEDAGT